MSNRRKVVANFPSISVRLSHKLKRLLYDHIESSTHLNISEFCRAALREKLQRDSHELITSSISHPNEKQATAE